MLNTKEVAKYLRISPQTVASRFAKGKFPSPDHVAYGGRGRLWKRTTIDRYIGTGIEHGEEMRSSDIAKALGISTDAFNGRVSRGKFPPPAGRTRDFRPGNVWRRKDVAHLLTAPDTTDHMDAHSVGKTLGIGAAAVRSASRLGNFPKADAIVNRQHHWHRETVEAHIHSQKKRHADTLTTLEIASAVGVTGGAILSRLKNGSFPLPIDPSVSAPAPYRWNIPTVRAWLTEHMPDRLPALDALLAERESTTQRNRP